MQADAMTFLTELMAAPSPSGFEQPAQKVIRARMEKFADEVRTDVHGNVIGIKNPDAEFRVMLAGHADEIGLMVTYVDENGFCYFQPVGGIDPTTLIAKRVQIHGPKGPVEGVIGKKPIHLLSPEERKKSARIEDMWIDIGAKNRKDAQGVVEVGSVVTIDVPFQQLRNGMAVSRGFDDKAGAFAVAETLRLVSRRRLDIGVYAVATVQEELGLRGATTSAFGICPQAGIAVDVGFASDCPTIDKKQVGDVALGKGPILHRGANMNPVLQELIEEAAKKKNIPVQMQAEPRATGTDANVMQLSRAGVATSLISIPNRYMHTPVEMISLKDLRNTSRLIAAVLTEIKPGMDFTP